MFQIKTTILYNKKVQGDYFHLVFESLKIAGKALPGQFLNIRIGVGNEPLLRRPFSIHRVKGRKVEILYEVIGQGTKILSQRKTGEFLDIIGPLGNGFNYTLHAARYTLPILVAGGMGVAPLMFLAEKLNKRKTLILIGAKTKNHILCEKDFKKLGCEVKIASDDGSHGFKGYVSELLKNELYAKRYTLNAIYACGPRPMLKEISLISKQRNMEAQISLEEHMACGIGACLGCVIGTTKGYKRVCKDGPVFNAEEIIWE